MVSRRGLHFCILYSTPAPALQGRCSLRLSCNATSCTGTTVMAVGLTVIQISCQADAHSMPPDSLMCRSGDGAPLELVQPSALRQRSWPRPPRDSPGQPALPPLGPGFAAVSLSGLHPGSPVAGGPGGAVAPVTGPQLQVDSPSASGGGKADTGSAAAGTLAEEAGLPSFSALLPRSPSSPFEPRVR